MFTLHRFPAPQHNPAPPRAGNTLIMVVDDEPFIRRLLRTMLEDEGYQVITACDGQQALMLYQSQSPAMVLLDLQMPKMDGISCCAGLRRLAEGSPLPVLMLTSEPGETAIEEAFQAGASDYFIKPVNMTLLAHKVKQMLHLRETEIALKDSHDRLSHSQRLAGMGHWEYSTRNGQLRFSPELRHLLGLADDTPVHSLLRFSRLVHREDRRNVTQHIVRALRQGTPYTLEHRMVGHDGLECIVQHHGEAKRDVASDDCELVATLIDITERRHTQELIEDQTFFDSLTGLPNRLSFTNKLGRYMAEAERREQLLGVLFVGLDRFKNINDSLGHSVGDLLLQQITKRLTGLGESILMVSRFSGDIFTVLVGEVSTVDAIEEGIGSIHGAFATPFAVDGNEFYLSVSIGCAIHPLCNDTPEQLIKSADAAMFQAKNGGGNCCVRYSSDIDAKVTRRLSLETSLRKALEREEFTVHYQPQVAVHNGRIIGMEALVRWNRPGAGLVPPDVFIPIAEETGLIVPLGAWVMETAARQVADWARIGYGLLRVGINLSARQFEQRNLLHDVEGVISRTGIQPCCLDLEITESSAMHNIDKTIATLNQLRELGVQSSMDDFGTGYSSLSYLHDMPLQTLKIDRAFIMNITDNGANSDLARIIILMCHTLGLNVIAEGVETEAQMNFLLKHHCSEAQGYYISRPLPCDAFEQLLQRELMPQAQDQAANLTLF